jgi:REP element-mobilizing transposase RayT
MSRFKKLAHVVWCPKYWFRILKGDIAKSIREIIRQLCEWRKVEWQINRNRNIEQPK